MNESKDLDLLLEIAEEQLEKPEVKHESCFNEATRFIMTHDVEVGSERIPPVVIWDAYKIWKRKINENIELPENEFYKQLAKIFKKKKVNGYIYYMLNPTPFDLTDENIARLRKEQIYERNEKKKEQTTLKKIKKIDKELNKEED